MRNNPPAAKEAICWRAWKESFAGVVQHDALAVDDAFADAERGY
jgi:hypothetical protein